MPPPPDSASVERATSAIWHELLGRDSVKPDDDLRMLGATSLMFLTAFVRVNNMLGISVPLSALVSVQTLQQFSDTVLSATFYTDES